MAEGILAPVRPARLSTHFVAAYRLGFGALGLAAILAPLGKQIEEGNSLVNFFSFFTIQSNLMLVVVFIVGGWALLSNRDLPNWDLVRGATTAYMATTGSVYVLLLSGLEEELQTPMPWVNTVLHYWLPVVAVADWIIDRPDRAIPFRKALVWLVYPLLYLAYSIARGLGVDWYPYPFLDPDHEAQGWDRVAITCTVIFLAFTVVVWLMSVTSGWRPGGSKPVGD